MNSRRKFCYLTLISIFLIGTIGCKGQKDTSENTNYKNDIIQLDLDDKMQPQRIEASFPSLGLQYLCTIDKSRNIAVYSIDLNKTTIADAIVFLDKEVGVESAHRSKGCNV